MDDGTNMVIGITSLLAGLSLWGRERQKGHANRSPVSRLLAVAQVAVDAGDVGRARRALGAAAHEMTTRHGASSGEFQQYRRLRGLAG